MNMGRGASSTAAAQIVTRGGQSATTKSVTSVAMNELFDAVRRDGKEAARPRAVELSALIVADTATNKRILRTVSEIDAAAAKATSDLSAELLDVDLAEQSDALDLAYAKARRVLVDSVTESLPAVLTENSERVLSRLAADGYSPAVLDTLATYGLTPQAAGVLMTEKEWVLALGDVERYKASNSLASDHSAFLQGVNHRLRRVVTSNIPARPVSRLTVA
jgi:hypothetical protein